MTKMQKRIVSTPLAISVIRSNVLGTAATCFVNIVSGSAALRWTSHTPAHVIASNIASSLAGESSRRPWRGPDPRRPPRSMQGRGRVRHAISYSTPAVSVKRDNVPPRSARKARGKGSQHFAVATSNKKSHSDRRGSNRFAVATSNKKSHGERRGSNRFAVATSNKKRHSEGRGR